MLNVVFQTNITDMLSCAGEQCPALLADIVSLTDVQSVSMTKISPVISITLCNVSHFFILEKFKLRGETNKIIKRVQARVTTGLLTAYNLWWIRNVKQMCFEVFMKGGHSFRRFNCYT